MAGLCLLIARGREHEGSPWPADPVETDLPHANRIVLCQHHCNLTAALSMRHRLLLQYYCHPPVYGGDVTGASS